MKRIILALILGFFISSCRQDQPPQIEHCTLSPAGGGNCTLVDGSHKFKLPSEMKNYHATNQPDFAKLMSWCFDATPEEAAAITEILRKRDLQIIP